MLMTLLLAAATASAAPQTTYEMDQDAGRRFQAADKQLNQAYKKLLPALSAAQKAKLVKAETAWIAFRDGWAEVEGDHYRGGTISSTVYTTTRLSITETRTADLQLLAAHRWAPKQDPKDARTADRRLNARYKQLAKITDAPGRKLLLKGQQAWLAYRDADADFFALYYGKDTRQPRVDELTERQVGAIMQRIEP